MSLKKKRLLVSWKVASKRYSWIFSPLSGGYDSELLFTLLTTYTYHTYAHKTFTSKKYMYAQSTIDGKKWASYLLSRVWRRKASAHFIFNLASLYPTLQSEGESRHRKFKKELQLSRSMAREAVMRRNSAQQVRFYRFCAFLLLLSSKRRGCERDKVGSRCVVVSTNLPIQMSFQKSQIKKKKKRGF